MNGALAAQQAAPAPSDTDAQVQAIVKALDATLDPRGSNELRAQALGQLDGFKTQPDAPACGFMLAGDRRQNDAVRYYGLQLLEFSVRYRWTSYGSDQTAQLRDWVKRLAEDIQESDALFVRNKIAQLWADVAKRCWGEEWVDMDASLVALWERANTGQNMASAVLVLYVLETLSEDIVNREDAIAGLRLDALRTALNEIMLPHDMYLNLATVKEGRQELRHGTDGWLHRMLNFFALCVKESRMDHSSTSKASLSTCAIKALNALRPTFAWVNVTAVVKVGGIDCLFLPFHTEDVLLCTAATETLHALLNRPSGQHSHEGGLQIYRQALHPDHIELLSGAFDSAQSAPNEDGEKYTLLKRLSELLSVLADAVAAHSELATPDKATGMRFRAAPASVLGPALSAFLQRVLQHPSLVVSIPVLHSFTRLMTVKEPAVVELVYRALGPLLQTCSARLIRYESLGEDSEDQTAQFLYEDFDTMPERHAFLGNYRRYCTTIIQAIAAKRPLEVLAHVLEQMQVMLETGPYTFGRGFDSATYSKTNLAVLQFDAQFVVVSSALKGWSVRSAEITSIFTHDPEFAEREAEEKEMTTLLQQWCDSVINFHIDDPEVADLVLESLLSVLQVVKPEPGFVLRMVQHILTMNLHDNPAHETFSAAVKHFESLRVVKLQKLGLSFSNELLKVYNDLESRVGELAQRHQEDPRQLWGYQAFLFTIVHRAKGIESGARLSRLQAMLEPIYEGWRSPELSSSLSNFDSFCVALGLDALPDFYKAYGFDRVADWSSTQLDEAGQARQSNIKAKNDALPLRMTKSLLGATAESLRPGSDAHETASALWSPLVPVILPNLLKLLRFALAFYDMSSWAHLPPELQAVVQRTLQDRFWQSGISNETKDEFYARVTGSKTSYEGFASAVRGTMRTIREQGYHILYLLARFDEQFYGLTDLAVPLAEALFENADSLSATQLQPIINLSTGLVQQCPPHHRARFLPPLLIQLFQKLDRKTREAWSAIEQASETQGQDDALGEEMRTESVLRQLTHGSVSFVAFLLSFDRDRAHARAAESTASKPSLRDLVLSDPAVLEPLILFCTHALRMRDTRSCVIICKVFRNMVPLFAGDEAPAPQVREFISAEVLKACITSLNEPYFADLQKELAMLIANILVAYAPKTHTPRAVLASLPDMPEARVDAALGKVFSAPNERQQRALVLDLLDGVRGVSIYEQGKIAREPKKAPRSAAQMQYMEVEQRPAIVNGDEAGLDGVADLFGAA